MKIERVSEYIIGLRSQVNTEVIGRQEVISELDVIRILVTCVKEGVDSQELTIKVNSKFFTEKMYIQTYI